MLEVGYLSTQGKQRGTKLIRAIMDHPEEPEPYHNLVLAAESLHDVGQARTVGDLAGEIQARLRQAFEIPLKKGDDLSALIRRRAAAAEALGRIESGMFGMQSAFWRLPSGEPVWVEIPAGEFWMGSDRGNDDEKPVQTVHLGTFWISRVPITNAQYRSFVEDVRHPPPEHWEDGTFPRGKENPPVVNVSWHDAMNYCRWLEEKLKACNKTSILAVNLEPGAFNVELASEAQWEKASRGGGDGREYPWGDKWNGMRCNNKELGLDHTTPEGIFPEGSSPYGVLDLSGNVWEWTRSQLKDYPYTPLDDRDGIAGSTPKVMRGGAFDSERISTRCAVRASNSPDYRSEKVGFRVVFSPTGFQRNEM